MKKISYSRTIIAHVKSKIFIQKRKCSPYLALYLEVQALPQIESKSHKVGVPLRTLRDAFELEGLNYPKTRRDVLHPCIIPFEGKVGS
jgi:hypothetical protein